MAKDDRPGRFSPKTIQTMKRELLGIDGAEPSGAGRFKPDQSGNPKGRPKRMTEPMPSPDLQSLHAATVRIGMTPVVIKENGINVSIPMSEAIIRAQMTIAAKGNPLAQRDALLRYERSLCEVARERQEMQQFWQHYRDQKWAEIEKAKRNGQPLPTPLPHPDDIVIEPGEAVRINGPIDEDDMALRVQTCLFRDTLLLQDALDVRLAKPGDGYRLGGSLMWAMAFNNLIYKRFQLNENQLIWQSLRNAAIPKRELLKTLCRSWRTLGITASRGMRSASLDIVEALVQFEADIRAAIRAGDIDRDEFMRREFNDAALEIMARIKTKLAA